jgi:hypothetical protein
MILIASFLNCILKNALGGTETYNQDSPIFIHFIKFHVLPAML